MWLICALEEAPLRAMASDSQSRMNRGGMVELRVKNFIERDVS